MPAYFPPLRAVPSTHARGCRTSGCELAAQDPHDLCEPCDAVYAMAFALYWRLVERDIARMEAETPGIRAGALLLVDETEQRPARRWTAPPRRKARVSSAGR